MSYQIYLFLNCIFFYRLADNSSSHLYRSLSVSLINKLEFLTENVCVALSFVEPRDGNLH